MADPFRMLGQTEHQIVVLTPFKTLPESADLPDQGGPVHPQMTGIHEGKKGVGRPVRLEKG